MPDGRQLIAEGFRLERAGHFERALALYREASAVEGGPEMLSEVRRREAHALRGLCRWSEAAAAARDAVELAEEAGQPDLVAEALNAEGAVYQSQGNYVAAEALYQRMLEISVNDRIRGIALQNLGGLAAMRGELDEAQEYFRRSSDRFRDAGYGWGEALSLNNWGRASLDQGKVAVSKGILKAAVDAARTVQDRNLLALARLNYAEALALGEEQREAELHAREALDQFDSSGNHWRAIECLRLLGDLARSVGDVARAAQLYQRGLRIAREIGAETEEPPLIERLRTL